MGAFGEGLDRAEEGVGGLGEGIGFGGCEGGNGEGGEAV